MKTGNGYLLDNLILTCWKPANILRRFHQRVRKWFRWFATPGSTSSHGNRARVMVLNPNWQSAVSITQPALAVAPERDAPKTRKRSWRLLNEAYRPVLIRPDDTDRIRICLRRYLDCKIHNCFRLAKAQKDSPPSWQVRIRASTPAAYAEYSRGRRTAQRIG